MSIGRSSASISSLVITCNFSISTESDSSKHPDLVLIRLLIAAPQPSAFPMSAHMLLIYVPFEQAISNSNSLPSKEIISALSTNILRLFTSTSLPSLAYSYSFLPLTFSAEYMGGVCVITPLKFVTASCLRLLPVLY